MKLTGLTAAVHTPFDKNGELWLEPVEAQAQHLEQQGVSAVFVGGSTGESSSLTLTERLALAERWAEVLKGSTLQFVVHVGSNCLDDARTLAAQAQALGADAISALSPSYFKPANLESLVQCCAYVASAAPDTPFYFYDIPALTGVSFSMPAFLEEATARIPTLCGIKYTNPDLMAYQICLASGMDVPWGVDETLIAAAALGASGAVGSSYNFAASIYLSALEALAAGDLKTAQKHQLRAVELIQILASYGYMAAAKELMGMLGIPVGPPRLPHLKLKQESSAALKSKLESIGFLTG
jgi:N-acetylneuraminate lyase